jgi:hypothetical protein
VVSSGIDRVVPISPDGTVKVFVVMIVSPAIV